MDYFLGVDGGQSSSAALILDAEGAPIGFGTGGPTNHLDEPGAFERMENSLREAVANAWQSAGRTPQPFRAAVLGLTGRHPQQKPTAERAIAADRLVVINDVENALFAATKGGPGIVVILGTGSNCMGRNAAGETAQAGGWGYLLGDEGSAYFIGLEALRSICRASDGREQPTILTDAALRAYEIENLQALHRAVYSGAIDRPAIARFAIEVRHAELAGDAVAARIFDEAAMAIMSHIDAVAGRLGLNGETFRIGLTGGLADILLGRIKQHAAERHPQAHVQVVDGMQVESAAAQAWALGGGEITEEMVDRIHAELAHNTAKRLWGRKGSTQKDVTDDDHD